MTTKAELIEGWTKELKELQAKKLKLEEEHQTFKAEDDEQKIHDDRYDEIEIKIERYLQAAYKGNYGDYHAWYHGRIPARFSVLEEQGHERRDILKVLGEMKDKKLKELQENSEYIQLQENQEYESMKARKAISKRHNDIHEEIVELNHRLGYLKDCLEFVNDKGWFIQHCKSLAEQKRNQEERKQDEIRLMETRLAIMKLGGDAE
jgi:DNA repair exonuclease SbcCD ATPase subunit